MRLRRTKAVVAAVLPITLAGIAMAPTRAAAGDVSVQGWRGPCHYNYSTSTAFGGWCDGEGPEGYQAWIKCTDGLYYHGELRWYGDRRGSYAYCPPGHTRIWWGMGHEL